MCPTIGHGPVGEQARYCDPASKTPLIYPWLSPTDRSVLVGNTRDRLRLAIGVDNREDTRLANQR